MSWNRPWSLPEVIENAPNWSLAGDAGLLKYLESFSEDLLSRAEKTNDNLNVLLEDLNHASLSLNVVKNEFCSLHNIQFIESRVYEEDETLPVSDSLLENVKDDTKPVEEERINHMKEAVLRGIEVVDKYYEKVEVPASDSEDETDFPSFVLRPKDPYLDRTLPYIIGSEDWYNKWHVGLLDSSSDSETDKVSEKFSDSDSEGDLPVQDRSQFRTISNSGSEANLSNRRNINYPVANSTFDDSVKQPDIFGSSDSEEYNSVPVQAPISNRSFAQELAAKLGNVIEQNTEVTEPEVNKRPIQTVVPNRTIGNLFPDEPPPVDEDDALFGNNSVQQGFFSGTGGLFDDLDNNSSLWKKEKTTKKEHVEAPKSKLPNLFSDEEDDIFVSGNSRIESSILPEKSLQGTISKQISRGLFDDDGSEDDLFNENSVQHTSTKPFLPTLGKTSVPYFLEEPPELDSKVVLKKEDSIKSKKPIGGVKIFGDTDIFKQQKMEDVLKIRRQESHESSDIENINRDRKGVEFSPKNRNESNDLFDGFKVHKQNTDRTINKDYTEQSIAENADITFNKIPETDAKSEKNVKQLSLFADDDENGDDDSKLFEGDLFSNISTKNFTSSLFEEGPLRNDLFATLNVDKAGIGNDITKQFIGSSLIENNDKSFTGIAPVVQKISKMNEDLDKEGIEKLTTGVSFEADDTDNLFQTKSLQCSPISLLITENLDGESKDSESVTIDNHKDHDDEKHDHSTENHLNNVLQNTLKDMQAKNLNSSANITFFDQNPPDDDEWDTKSDNLFEENDSTLFDNLQEISSQRSGLFDNEPPNLFYESSGIVRDASARMETDDSFNPYASSSRRFSSDIFNEQQSSDSFFITKNKSQFDSHAAIPNFDIIPEISNIHGGHSSYSNVDITPSGNIDDLFSDSTGMSFQEQEIMNEKVENNSTTKTNIHSTNNDNNLFGAEDLLPDKSNTDLFKSPEKLKNHDLKISQKYGTDVSSNMKPPVAEKPNPPSTKTEVYCDHAVSSEDPVSVKIGSPGKLKHNLNINVNALMPGVAIPKRKDMEKSHSFEDTSSSQIDVIQLPANLVPNSSIQSKSNEELTQKNESKRAVERSVSFESSNFAEVLPSITKDRVRIPVKRRPSTRKARHESIRKSGIDFKVNVTEKDTEKEKRTMETDDIVSNSTKYIFEGFEKQEICDNVAVKSVFDDIFDSDENIFSSKTTNMTKKESSNQQITSKMAKEQIDEPQNKFLFDSPLLMEKPDLVNTETNIVASKSMKISDEKAVGNQSKVSVFDEPKRSVINSDNFESDDLEKSDLFDDIEEFDDIFSSKKLPPKSNILKKSLFDDELDDDDIFGPSTSEKTAALKNTGRTKASEKKSKTVQVRKLENTEAVEDPLSSFNDND